MATDPTPTQLDTLDPQIQWRALYMLNALRSIGIPAVIQPLGARRSQSEQLALYTSGTGVTSTTKSRHVNGMAFDLDIWGWNRNNVPDEFWKVLGPWAERVLGLTWGGRWSRPYDPGHFQL